jgi:hypothetical protein
MRNTCTFVIGFSIKIWLKFFGAVFLQPRFYFYNSPINDIIKEEGEKVLPFRLPLLCFKYALSMQYPCFIHTVRLDLGLFKSCRKGLFQEVSVNKTV